MIKHPTQNIAVHTWDWREQPDWGAITEVANEFVLEGDLSLVYVETGSDEHALVIAAGDLSDYDAQMYYGCHHEWEEGVDGMALDWNYALAALQSARRQAADKGMDGLTELQDLSSLLMRISDGERTAELHEEIIAASLPAIASNF